MDKLTGLYDRWGLDEYAGRLITRSAARGAVLAVLMIDLDRFKQINDTFGHLAGDEVLRAAATVLREVTGEDDVVGRFGGDEFVVLANVVDSAQAATLARRLQAAMETRTVPVVGEPGRPPLRITASVGLLVGVPGRTHSFEDLLRQADAALLAAKRLGRNRSCGTDLTGPSTEAAVEIHGHPVTDLPWAHQLVGAEPDLRRPALAREAG